MPIYTYIEPTSGEEKEVIHGMNESPEILSSKGEKMIKKISAVTLVGFDNWGRSKK